MSALRWAVSVDRNQIGEGAKLEFVPSSQGEDQAPPTKGDQLVFEFCSNVPSQGKVLSKGKVLERLETGNIIVEGTRDPRHWELVASNQPPQVNSRTRLLRYHYVASGAPAQ